MKYLSICSGIEAASVAWHPLGFTPVGFSEIEKFPEAVLSTRFPDVQNFGDFTQIQHSDIGHVDILVGGTPCQSWSVAGKRMGRDDLRGELTFEFIKMAERLKPTYVVWENVPGILSDCGGSTIAAIVDEFTRAGYVCDIDIHDAQDFGLAQRRKRVFLVCARLDDLVTKRTFTSERIMAELMLQALLATWVAMRQVLCLDVNGLDSKKEIELSIDFLSQKLILLGRLTDGNPCTKLLRFWEERQVRYTVEQGNSDSTRWIHLNDSEEGLIREFSKMATGGFGESASLDCLSEFKSIATSWSSILVDLLSLLRSSTISILMVQTIELKTCSFVSQVLTTLRSITDSKMCCTIPDWSSDYWNLESLLLTILKEFTDYAKSTSESLFCESSERSDWRDCFRRARAEIVRIERNTRKRRAAAVLFERESLRRDTSKGASKKQETAKALRGRSNSSHREDSDNFVTHSLRGEGFDASEDGTGRGTPLVVHACLAKGGAGRLDPSCETFVACTLPSSDGGVSNGMHPIIPCGTLKAHHSINGNSEQVVAFLPIAIGSRARGDDGRGYSRPEHLSPIAGTVDATKPERVLTQQMQVRRLTPLECERLQGFPDSWTAIEYRGKPACDGPRYKAIGNSMAVPVMRWIGRRLIEQEKKAKQ